MSPARKKFSIDSRMGRPWRDRDRRQVPDIPIAAPRTEYRCSQQRRRPVLRRVDARTQCQAFAAVSLGDHIFYERQAGDSRPSETAGVPRLAPWMNCTSATLIARRTRSVESGSRVPIAEQRIRTSWVQSSLPALRRTRLDAARRLDLQAAYDSSSASRGQPVGVEADWTSVKPGIRQAPRPLQGSRWLVIAPCHRGRGTA